MAQTFNEAVSIVDPKLSGGKLPSLWVAFAKMYEAAGERVLLSSLSHEGELSEAREVFERAVKVPYRTVEELGNVWCEYVEMEIRNKYVPCDETMTP